LRESTYVLKLVACGEVSRRAGRITNKKVMRMHHLVTGRGPGASFCDKGINVLMHEVDMSQMLGVKEQRGAGPGGLGILELQNVTLALELLRGCGMILKARLRTSPAHGRCHGPLSSRVHPSSVIWCNGLNLSRGSRV